MLKRSGIKYIIKYFIVLLYLLLGAMVLQGCIPINTGTSTGTVKLPKYTEEYTVPTDDEMLNYDSTYVLYLENKYTNSLNSYYTQGSFSADKDKLLYILESLFDFKGNETYLPLSEDENLKLYGSNAIECSGNLVTINLSPAALKLEKSKFHKVCRAITNTITKNTGYDYVNILVANKNTSLDIPLKIPKSIFEKDYSTEIASEYLHEFEKRENDKASESGTVYPVALYLPIDNSYGFRSSIHNISFDNFEFPTMAKKIIDEYSNSINIENNQSIHYSNLLEKIPEFSYSDEGGMVITIYLKNILNEIVDITDPTQTKNFAAMSYSLSSFFPNIAGVRMYVGDKLITNIRLEDFDSIKTIVFDNGIIKREQLTQLLLKNISIYLSNDKFTQLLLTNRLVSSGFDNSPRSILLELSKDVNDNDVAPKEVFSTIPKYFDNDSILGTSLEKTTLSINFSADFLKRLRADKTIDEKMFVYSIVNTFCKQTYIDKVRFFFEGDSIENIGGNLCWQGDFVINESLLD